jgi:hypothetical protein
LPRFLRASTPGSRGAGRVFCVLWSLVNDMRISPRSFIPLHSHPAAHMREGMKQSKYIEEPQHHGDDNDRIQDRFNRALHWYEAVDQPKQNTHHDQNCHYVK